MQHNYAGKIKRNENCGNNYEWQHGMHRSFPPADNNNNNSRQLINTPTKRQLIFGTQWLWYLRSVVAGVVAVGGGSGVCGFIVAPIAFVAVSSVKRGVFMLSTLLRRRQLTKNSWHSMTNLFPMLYSAELNMWLADSNFVLLTIWSNLKLSS